RRPKARNLVFGADSTPTKGHLPGCKLAIAICSAMGAHSRQRLKSHNVVIEERFCIGTRSSLTLTLFLPHDHSLSLLIMMAIRNSNWVDDVSSAARVPNTTRLR